MVRSALGTNAWTRIAQTFLVPTEARLVEVQMVRPRSLKNDSQIRGTAWIGLATLAPIQEKSRESEAGSRN
jgi:hypothetical protein